MLYAVLVFLIFASIYCFSLSNSLGFTNANWNIVITMNNANKYPGIVTKEITTFFVFFSLKNLIALNTATTINIANITYPHNFMVTLVKPAPYILVESSSCNVTLWSIPKSCVLNII